MNVPFDPSKLNLDLNSKEENNTPKAEDTPLQQKTETKLSTDPLANNDQEAGNVDIHTDTSSPDNKQTDPLSSNSAQIPQGNGEKDEIPQEIDSGEVQKAEEDVKIQEDTPIKQETQKIVDINVSSLESIVSLIVEKEYEYVTIEPEDSLVKITFRQDNIDRDIKYIKYPVYTSILFKIKQISGLSADNMDREQEGKGSLKMGMKSYKIATKTSPGQNGEKVWLKAKEDKTKVGATKKQKASLSMIFGFLGAILFIGLILGGAFIAFIVMNAKTVEDVKFFASLGINLNDINAFISQVVTLIFSILLFICTAALSVSLFKFLLSKKNEKRKKVVFGMLSGFLLIVTFSVGMFWMTITQAINNLPNWQEQAYGDLKIFDNALLVSQDFDEQSALLAETENLIGPATLQFDLSNYQTNQARKGLNIKKYVWNIGKESIETFAPNLTYTFDETGNYEITVIAVGSDVDGEEVSQDLTNMPPVSISHVIDVQETITSNGGKKLRFDANSLSNLGNVEWYFYEPTTESNPNPKYTEWTRIDEGYEFIPGKIFFEDMFVGVSIVSGNTQEAIIDKVIFIDSKGSSEISGEITFEQSLENEKEFTFYVQDPSTGFSSGFIESYQWQIEDKTYNKNATLDDGTSSPKITHIFESFGENTIRVTLTDSTGKSETLTKIINIQKQLELRSPLSILDNNGDELEDIRYEARSHEYYIDELAVPTTLKLEGKYIRPKNILYSLKNVEWDIDDDGDIDDISKSFDYEVPTAGNHILSANYTFVHRKNPSDTITLKEYIFIEALKKDAILDLKMEYENNYAPVSVRFDASKSFIKNDDIVKFVYDYGDGIIEERDSINPGHRYKEAGDYTVKLTVVGESGKTYSLEKKLILLPPAQKVNISSSMKTAPIGQGIDFSSSQSVGQIVEYFWDFGDGNISTEANPSHSYSSAGTYEIKLRADFANSNSISDSLEVEIME